MEKRLYRSKKDRKLCGVCGGIAEYFNVDPTMVRLLWLLLTLISFGKAIIIYLICCFVIPEEK